MIVEQAFHSLPEVLLGSHYFQQDYEAGIVGLFSLAILQELNGRNAPNPLSFLRAEALYEQKGFRRGKEDARYLRADLKLSLARLGVGTDRLREYGWREDNWIEAKFMRSSSDDETSKVTQATQNTALLLADILRLAILVPEQAGLRSNSARYLLHVYDSPPDRHLSGKSTAAGGTRPFEREWVDSLIKPGQQVLAIKNFADENKVVRDRLGYGIDLEAHLCVTNFTLSPRGNKVLGKKRYWCCLTRVDSINVIMADRHFELSDAGEMTEDTTGDFHAIRGIVGGQLGVAKRSEQVGPDADEVEA